MDIENLNLNQTSSPKHHKILWSVIIGVLLLVVIGGSYYWWQEMKEQREAELIASCNTKETFLLVREECAPYRSSSNSQKFDWKTYTNTEYGFEFKYPGDWEMNKSTSNSDYPVVNLLSPETKKALAERNVIYPSDLAIYYYNSIADEPENSSNNLKAKTLDEFIKKDPMIKAIGPTTLGGIPAIEVTWGGFGVYYAILAEKDSHIYKIWFANQSAKEQLGEIQKEILSTFKFITPTEVTK